MYYNLVVLFSLICLSCSVKQNSYENQDLFSDKNKGLWYIEGQDKDTHDEFWELKDGVLTCKTSGNTSHPGSWYVFKSPIDDFEFKVDFRYDKSLRGNSGIQFRSKYDFENNKMQGPQIDIHPPLAFRTGLLYDETDGVKHWLYPVTTSWRLESFKSPNELVVFDDGIKWNTLELQCFNGKVITKVNGTLLVDYNGLGVLNDQLHTKMGVGMKGLLSFQLHKKHDIFIQFRNCYIKTL